MTKSFEEVVRGDLSEISAHYSGMDAPKGECVVVLGPPLRGEDSSLFSETLDIDMLLSALLTSHGVKGASSLVSDVTGMNRKVLYKRAQTLKDQLP